MKTNYSYSLLWCVVQIESFQTSRLEAFNFECWSRGSAFYVKCVMIFFSPFRKMLRELRKFLHFYSLICSQPPYLWITHSRKSRSEEWINQQQMLTLSEIINIQVLSSRTLFIYQLTHTMLRKRRVIKKF